MNSLEKIFENNQKEQKGNKRSVESMQGKYGVDFMMKDIESGQELEALKFLSQTGISEELLSYDGDKLLIEKIKGVHFNDYLDELISQHPQKISESTELSQETTSRRFKIHSKSFEGLPLGVLLGDEKIKSLYADFVSKLFFTTFSGVIHGDLKRDNVFIDEDEKVRFIDFGEASIVGTEKIFSTSPEAVFNLYKGLELLTPINSNHEFSKKNEEQARAVREFLDGIYSEYENRSILLTERPAFLIHFLESQDFKDISGKLNIPDELLPVIRKNIKDLCEKF